MTYVDGYVIPAPKSKIAAYKKMATWGKKLWMKHGADPAPELGPREVSHSGLM
jgi:uncharacterized protein YbaA (DUF1428 family)